MSGPIAAKDDILPRPPSRIQIDRKVLCRDSNPSCGALLFAHGNRGRCLSKVERLLPSPSSFLALLAHLSDLDTKPYNIACVICPAIATARW